MKNKTTKETMIQTIIKDSKKYKVEVKDTSTELKNINDDLLEFYNTPGMALQFQPSNLKILKKLIKRLIILEDILYGKDKPIQISKGINFNRNVKSR
tara:strand:- start:69 stop:359 length:291 start_codon:yes stop_codon:yes gene_type:complete